jgi:hypothetical protein
MRLSVRPFARLAAFVGLTGAFLACESTLSIPSANRTWGFIQHSAVARTGGVYVTSPKGEFFRGSLTSIPDARVRPDSCIELFITPTNPLAVTYIDAGASIVTQFGARADTIPRVTSASKLSYEVSSPRSYQPGESLIPAAEIRAKTAEAFTLDSLIIRPSPAAVQLRWTPATDQNSALLAEFRYSSSGGTAFNQLIRCAFVDDGADSIPYRILQPWIGQSGASRTVTYTRLRTQINAIVDGYLEVISTFAVPTPTSP